MAKQLVSRTKDIAKRPSRYLEEPLYHRLFKDGSSEQNVRAQMNAFLKSRKLIYKWELDDTLKKLRSFKLYSPALKLSETMAYRGINKTLADQAIHLDLIAKSNGITAAEDYFVALPESKKEIHCYGALLNVYCTESKATKAESLLEKMKELKLPLTSMSYNSMMTLYANKNQPEKILAATKEMKLAGIALDCFSYNIWMRAYASLDDIAGAERVVEEMKRDGQVPPDWTTFSNLASIYVNAGSNEEAEIALKELEKVNAGKDLSAFQFLITLYGRTGNLVEVYRVWRSLKLSFEKPTNTSYLHYIKVLVRLKDLPGAEKAFEEWLESSPAFDIRIANTLIGGYARSGSIDEAQRILKLARLRGAKPNLRTWVVFFEHYMKSGEFGAAVECVVKAIWVAGERGQRWAPPRKTVMSLMEYFEREKDVDSAEAFLERLKTCSRTLHPEILEALIRIYASAGKTSASLRRRLKMEGVDQVSEDGEKLLEIVCVV